MTEAVLVHKAVTALPYVKQLVKKSSKQAIAFIENYKKNLLILNNKLEQRNLKPIFITQITYDINGKKKLYPTQ